MNDDIKKRVISLNDISKTYTIKRIWKGEKKVINALTKINFSVNEGEILGILGPNGAGKSTLIKIMAMILKEDSGKLNILNENDEAEIKKKINIIFGGERGLYWRLTGEENLDYFAELYGISGEKKIKKIADLLRLVGLSGKEKIKVEKYSKGMKQRLQIARGLINDPLILFLDEPTIGLDIINAMKFRNLIKNLAKSGKTIIFTTHYIKEAEEICDRILFINKGKIVSKGTIEELRNKILKKRKINIIYFQDKDLSFDEKIFGLENLKIKKNQINFFFNEEYFDYKSFINSLPFEKIKVFEMTEASLEDLYINIIGE